MAELTCQFVSPDKLLYEGTVESLILASADGDCTCLIQRMKNL